MAVLLCFVNGRTTPLRNALICPKYAGAWVAVYIWSSDFKFEGINTPCYLTVSQKQGGAGG